MWQATDVDLPFEEPSRKFCKSGWMSFSRMSLHWRLYNEIASKIPRLVFHRYDVRERGTFSAAQLDLV